MKNCPFCAELIQDKAVKCKQCGEHLDGGGGARSQPPTATELPAGRLLEARCRVVAVAGCGGMGAVYRAQDLELKREVALKVLPLELSRDARAQEQLKEEARIGLELTDRNIVRLYDFRELDGLTCLVVEFVGGGSLWDRLEQQPRGLSEAMVVSWLREASAGLAYAHARGVLHRDIKLGNLLLAVDGTVKVADFGIARVARDSYTKLTGRVTSGTLAYMSPEQLRGKRCDTRSYIYSVGATVYELLSGEPPFADGDITYQHIHEAPEPIAGVRGWLWELLERMLAKDSAARPQTMAEVVAALEEGPQRVEAERQTECEAEEKTCK